VEYQPFQQWKRCLVEQLFNQLFNVFLWNVVLWNMFFQNQLEVHCRNIHSRCHPSLVLLADTVMLYSVVQILYVYEVIASNLREQGYRAAAL
jgi:hypothetical protein